MLRAQKIKKALKDCCPLCGGKLPPTELTVDLSTNMLHNGEKAVKVGPNVAEVIWLLRERYPGVVEREHLVSKIWPSMNVETKTVETTICHARAFLAHLGWGIQSEYKIGVRLVKGARIKAKEKGTRGRKPGYVVQR